jgi:hypothetical protein
MSGLAEVFRYRATLSRTLRVAVLAICVSACSSDKPVAVVEPNLPPTNYRAEILSYLQATLPDPTGVRDAYIAEPALRPSGSETRFVACLRYNAKGADGNYLGMRERAAYFYAGRINTIGDSAKEQCGNAPYQPFPELQKLCREIVCPGTR